MNSVPFSSVREWHGTLPVGFRFPKAIGSLCPRCGERVIFSLLDISVDQKRSATSATAICPACTKPIHFWAVLDETRKRPPNNYDPTAIYMYPPLEGYYAAPVFHAEIPAPLQRAFASTVDAFNSKNYTATAVCGRRTLEGIFKYLVVEDKRNVSLARLIEFAKDGTDLAAPLTSLSHAIRDGGNLGAHFDMEKEPNEGIARQMVELLEYLISYLYVLPEEIKKLEQSLGRDA